MIGTIARIKPVYRLLKGLRRICGRSYMRACHALTGARPYRVFFSSFKGRSYSDSPARISEQLHALRPDAEIVWQLWNAEGAPDYVRVVRPRSLAALKAISTARCLVDNFNRQQYDFQFYGVTPGTGHVTLYYNTDDNVQVPVNLTVTVDDALNVTAA